MKEHRLTISSACRIQYKWGSSFSENLASSLLPHDTDMMHAGVRGGQNQKGRAELFGVRSGSLRQGGPLFVRVVRVAPVSLNGRLPQVRGRTRDYVHSEGELP